MEELKNTPGNEMTEAQICRKVLGKKSRYIKGRGFGPLPEEAFTSRHSQQHTRAETRELRSEVLRLTELVASCNEANAQLLANQARTKAILKRFQESIPDLATLSTDNVDIF